jgi:hypothetical protein
VEAVAHESAHMFEQLPGLRLKAFTLDEPSRCALNFYLWESRGAATAFFTPELAESAKAFYGIPPSSVEFFDVAGVVDNSLSAEAVA